MSEKEKKLQPLNKNFREPKLRFNGFNSSWNTIEFLKLFVHFSTNSLSWDFLNYQTGNIKNLHYGLIHSSKFSIFNSCDVPFINSDSIPKKFTLYKSGDLILADTSENKKDVGKPLELILDEYPIVCGLHTMHFREIKPVTIPFYKSYYFSSNIYHKFTYKYSEGVKVLSLKPSLFKYFDFSYPCKDEQIKIVKFLKLIDEKIKILDSKVSTLKKYKKGFVEFFIQNCSQKQFIELKKLITYSQSTILLNNIIEGTLFPVYDASGHSFMMTDSYKTKEKSIAIIKYGSSCGRTFLTSGNHTVLGTMGEMIPLNIKWLNYIYAYTTSKYFKKNVQKYIEIGTTPNLYFSDYGNTMIPIILDDKISIFNNLFDKINLKILLYEDQLQILNKIKKDMLKNLFI